MNDVVKFIAGNQLFFLTIVFVWNIVWKGIALWRASSYKQRNWFIAILVLNTFAVVEIVYLFRFCKKRLTIEEIKSWFSQEKKK